MLYCNNVALAMWHRIQRFIHLWAHDHPEGDEHPTYAPNWSMVHFFNDKQTTATTTFEFSLTGQHIWEYCNCTIWPMVHYKIKNSGALSSRTTEKQICLSFCLNDAVDRSSLSFKLEQVKLGSKGDSL